MEVGLVHKIDIDSEMQQAYLDYAMSVIIARALPDARDGLKPVHRRILYAMYDMGLRADSPYKKSARIVGEVLGKYHPHGDMAVYETMARMAQDFSMRYLLVDGQGNFGSVDGDPPAAMRYTEARLAAPALHLLADIGKNTVDFSDNFDNTLTEPVVLPAAIPNLLVNGATGIAVGMATNIPPHNLGEIVNALQYLLENWEKLDDVNVEDLMHFVQGPDFPTGGVIIHDAGEDSLISAYSTGRGKVTVQASAHLEEMERGRNRIIVTELPFMTNKASLIERIAELAREEKLEGIVDLRDESDRQGMRIVIELSKTADPQDVLRDLYKHTPMQNTFGIIMLALVDGEPRLLSLKQALRVYLEHRLEIVRRRGEYDLERARQRAHILEGLRVALKHLDEIIDLIRRAPDAETAHARLMKKYKLSDIQAQAILDMPLKRLAALERKKIEDEYKELAALIKTLEGLLHSPKKMRQVVSEELATVQETYGDRRKTHIIELKDGEKVTSLLTSADLLPEKAVWISVTPEGLISRSLDDNLPRLSGKEAPAWLARANTRDTLYLVCAQGEAAAIPVHAVPEAETPADGVELAKVSVLREQNQLVGMFALPTRSGRDNGDSPLDTWFIITATRQGMLKKSSLAELPGPSANLFTLAKVNEGDRLEWLKLSNGKNEVLLATAQGMAIRFSEEEVRPMGLVAAGVMGIKLQAGDELAGIELLPQPGDVFMVASDGGAKRVKTDQFPTQGRYGQGVLAWKMPNTASIIGITVGKGTEHAILHLKKLAPKSIRLDEAPLQTRMARGAVIQDVKAGDQVLRLTIPWDLPGEKTTAKKAETVKVTLPAAEIKNKTAPAGVTKSSAAIDKALAATAPATKAAKTNPATAKAVPTSTKATKPAPVSAKATTKATPASVSAAKSSTATKARPISASAKATKASPAAAKTKTVPASKTAKASPTATKAKLTHASAKTTKTGTATTKAKPASTSAKATKPAPASAKTTKASTTATKAKPTAASKKKSPASRQPATAAQLALPGVQTTQNKKSKKTGS